MKIVTYDKSCKVVLGVYYEVNSPEIDRDEGIIFHENGTFHNINSNEFGHILVEDYAPILLGDTLTEEQLKLDQSDKYDGAKLNDIGAAIKNMGKEVAEEIKDLFKPDAGKSDY